MNPVKTLSLLALLTSLILPLSGTDMPEKDIILITEERQEAESEAGQKTVIPKESWERKGARTVAEAIDLTAGVTVSQTGTALENSTVSIRGAGGEQVLIMVNGIPLNNGKGDPVNLNTLSLNNVISIEVIRGGNSAVYGEGAFGGAVNLITSQDPVLYGEGEVYLKAGSFQAYTGGGSFKLPLNTMGTLSAAISGEYRRVDGDYDYESGTGSTTRTNSSGWADNAAAGIEWNVGGMDRHRLSLDFSCYKGERGIPGLMEFLTPQAELEESRLNLSTRYRFTAYTGMTLDTEYSYIQQDSFFTNPDTSSEDEHENSSFRGRLDLRNTWKSENWTFIPLLGGLYSRDALTSTSLRSSNGTTLPGEANQKGGSLYSRMALETDDITITPAYRWDFNTTEYAGWEDSSDDHSSWSLTVAYTLPSYQKLSFKGNIGTAYHSPGFDDLFWSGGSFASGNPDLLPEESFNWDGGVTLRPFKGLEISSVYYQVATENLIQWLPTAGGTWSPANIGKVEGQGLENIVSWLIPLNREKILFLDMSGSYTWMRMQEKTEDSINKGNQLPYRPEHSGSASFSLMKNKHSLTLSANYMGQRFTNMANTKDLDPVLTCDSTLKLVFDSGFYSSFSLLNMGEGTVKTGIPRTGERVVYYRRIPILKKVLIPLCLCALFLSCSDSIETDYQEYLSKGYDEVLLILNGEAESFSAYSPSDERVYQNLQLVGHNGSSEAWPNDLLHAGGSLYTVCSGQNTIEKYDAETLDYRDKIYLKNGFNPMTLCLLGDGSKAAVAGFETDEIILVDLAEMEKTSGFIKSYEEATITNPANSETKIAPSQKNACGENQHRKTTGLAASGTALYASNVRYDTTILLTDSSGDLIPFNGSNVRAAGYFREGTLSVFQLSSDNESATLVREINLQNLYETAGGEAYYPGNGLNPQSLFVLNGKLHIICTGTNGGSARTYSSSEYIPDGSSTGDTVPGTDPDDGVVLILDMTDPLNPGSDSVGRIEIGGSPVGFRHSADEGRNIFYMAGVGGVQSYNYVSESALHDSDNLILAGSDPSADFYSHILYRNDRLYISDYSHDKLNRLSVSDNGGSTEYDLLDSLSTGDGPGALTYIKY